MIGKIVEKIDESYGYIKDLKNNLYLFSISDILDDTSIIIGTDVLFKPIKDKIPLAVYISRLK